MAAIAGSVLIIDDEPALRQSLRRVLEDEGFAVSEATDTSQALALISAEDFDLILCDIQLPGGSGLDFTKELRNLGCRSTLILMSAFGSDQTALEAIKLGAYDYLSKPFRAEDLLLTIRKAEERERLRRENEVLRSQVGARYSFNNIVSKSPTMLSIFETIRKIADYKTTVMIYGESGTGKELIAKAIHHNSMRRTRRFIGINCGAIPENLLESELFGHRKGAFTDATKDKKGLFEEANGGTLLLDEVGELPLHLQVKLLRVLQEGEIRRVGDGKLIPVDVRIIAATLRDLEHDVIEGRFRDDLFYRLNVINVRIPPLRERREDIPVLADYFLRRNQERLGLPVVGISKGAMSLMIDHEWPGNVRELENCIERAMILTDSDEITTESLPPSIAGRERSTSQVKEEKQLDSNNLSIKHHTRVIEERLIRSALGHTEGNRTKAARLLEISHRTLLYKLKEYEIADADEPAEPED